MTDLSASTALLTTQSKDSVANMGATQHPLDSIIRKPDPSPINGKKQIAESPVDESPADEPAARPRQPAPSVSLNSIKSPALLIDRRMRVIWQNPLAIDQIWQNTTAVSNGHGAPQLFDLLFDAQFQGQVENWRRWVSFFITQAHSFIPEDKFELILEQMTDVRKDALAAFELQMADRKEQSTFNVRLHQVLNDGRITSYGVVATDFKQGRLLVFEPIPSADGPGFGRPSHDIEQRIEGVRQHPNPIKLNFSIMAANLDNAVGLNLEMLPDEYSILINDLCQRSIETIERYGGVFSKHLDSGFFAYFLPLDENEDNALRTVECCLELRAQIAELSREWKLRKSWTHDIEMNMGIHQAYEHIGTLSSYTGEMVASSGSALRLVTNLSRAAREGQIWATKTLFRSMPPDIYKQLRFGVMKGEEQQLRSFVHRCFTVMKNLPGFKADDIEGAEALDNMAVTQIFDRQV